MSIIIPANSAVSGGFTAANSLMFNSADSASLSRTMGTSTSELKHTCSMWFKRSKLSSEQFVWMNREDGSNRTYFRFNATDTISFQNDGGSSVNLQTTQKFRDVGAWYNIVIAIDTTQATSSNRVKIYINGVQITSFIDEVYPAEDAVFSFNNVCSIGNNGDGALYFGGYIAETVIIDGTQNAPTDFGEFDEDSGIWKPIDVSGLTFGDNGFYLDFEDSSALGNDANGSNNFSLNNLAATDQATDTCTNNFTTWNSLNFNLNANTLSNGNTKMNGTADAAYPNSITSIGMPKSGKWYAEFKDVGTEGFALGIADMPTFINALRTDTSATIFTTGGSGAAILRNAGDVIISGSETSGVTPSFSQNDIAMIAYDADNGAFYAGRNGTFGSVGGVVGDPTSGASRTGAINISGQSWLIASQEVGFIVGSFSGSKFSIIEANFGNPFFAITSGNADGDGSGDFEYAVPSGYFALCTKNLAEYG